MLLAWQPTGTLLAIASYDDTWLLGFAKNAKLRIWGTITGQAVGSSPYIEDAPLLSLSWDRQGNRLIVTSYNSQFWIWDKNGLSNINWYKESGTETYAIVLDATFSPDGKYILILANVCCAGPSPHIWDVTTHKFLQSDLHAEPGEVMGNPGAYAWGSAGEKLYMSSWYGKPYNYSNHATPFPEQTTVYIKTIFRTASQDTTTSARALTLASSATWITPLYGTLIRRGSPRPARIRCCAFGMRGQGVNCSRLTICRAQYGVPMAPNSLCMVSSPLRGSSAQKAAKYWAR